MTARPEYRSTTLAMVERHCLHALELYETGVPRDRSVFHRGTAAHAMLQAAGEEAEKLDRQLTEDERGVLANGLLVALTTHGRDFEGEPEPPLPEIPVAEGIELALRWLDENGDPRGAFEVGYAMDRDGKPCDYGKAWYRAILDHECIEEVDGGLQTALIITDYKSYWSADASLLKSRQIKGQAVLAWLHGRAEGVDEIRLRIANLQSGGFYTETIYIQHESGAELLERWRDELLAFVEGIEKERTAAGGFTPRPGPNCYGCPYARGQCQAFREMLALEDLPETPEDRARLFAVVDARRQQLMSVCKADADGGPIAVDGRQLGTFATETATPAEGAHAALAAEWVESNGDVSSLLYGLKIGSGNLKALARSLCPRDTEAQAAWLEGRLTTKTGSKFEWREG